MEFSALDSNVQIIKIFIFGKVVGTAGTPKKSALKIPNVAAIIVATNQFPLYTIGTHLDNQD